MAESTMERQEAMRLQAKNADILNQLTKPEVQEALTALVENLPKLAEMTTLLTKVYDLARTGCGRPGARSGHARRHSGSREADGGKSETFRVCCHRSPTNARNKTGRRSVCSAC